MARPIHQVLHRTAVRHGFRLVRFGLVGMSGVLVNMAMLYFLVEFARIPHLPAAAIASEISIFSNFVLNDRWTFRDASTSGSWLRRALQYNGVALGGTAISLVVLAILTNGLHMYYLTANLLAIGAATISNYVLNSRFTWASPAASEEDPLAA